MHQKVMLLPGLHAFALTSAGFPPAPALAGAGCARTCSRVKALYDKSYNALSLSPIAGPGRRSTIGHRTETDKGGHHGRIQRQGH
jgi:hypothetical protein